MPLPADLIPHRPPFLLLDEIVSLDETAIRARVRLRPGDGFWSGVYAGHYPGQPITPGVLLCEIIFQAGAALMSRRLGASGATQGTPVVTRIRDAKFRRMVRPDELLEVEAVFDEQVSTAFYLHGSIRVGEETAVRVEFSCALVAPPAGPAA